MKSYKLILLFLLVANLGFTQLPNCNIFLFDLVQFEDKINLSEAYHLTDFNTNGYNNQPFFLDADQIIFSSNYMDSDSTDLWIINIDDDLLYQYTDTEGISEFSPKLNTQNQINTVRIERDGTSQKLWEYPFDRSSFGKATIKNINNIGYYEYISDEEIVMFLVDTTHQLARYDLVNKRLRSIIDNPGRTFQLDRDGNLIFVHKIGSTHFLKSYDIEENIAKTITLMPDGKEDFIILEDGKYLSSTNDNKLVIFDDSHSTDWNEAADLNEFEITDISRLVKYRNKLVLVANFAE